MPHANIWIRKEDWETWQTLGNKSQWLSDALNGTTGRIPPKTIVKAINQSMADQRKAVQENPFACSRCGKIKTAGKCLTTGCKG